MNILLTIILLALVSCKVPPNEHYPATPSERITYINNPVGQACVEGEIAPLPGTELPVELSTSLSKKSCSSLCKNNFEILPEKAPAMGFLNFPIPGHLGIGRCRGHAIITQQFNMLANFGTGENKNNCGPDKMSSLCMILYKNAIRNITENNTVADIPGFKSLAEFSSHPLIYPILYKKVIGYGSRFAAGLGSVDSSGKSKDADVFNELYKRTNNRQMPYIGIKGTGISNHAVLVSSTKVTKEGKRLLCVSDPNKRSYNPLTSDNCQNYIFIENGEAKYSTNGLERTLSKFNLISDEDYRIDQYVKARRLECMKNLESLGECNLNSNDILSN